MPPTKCSSQFEAFFFFFFCWTVSEQGMLRSQCGGLTLHEGSNSPFKKLRHQPILHKSALSLLTLVPNTDNCQQFSDGSIPSPVKCCLLVFQYLSEGRLLMHLSSQCELWHSSLPLPTEGAESPLSFHWLELAGMKEPCSFGWTFWAGDGICGDLLIFLVLLWKTRMFCDGLSSN